jgi:exopolysaccharide biosynthesis polyprenyl glycosylphosphotransferase
MDSAIIFISFILGYILKFKLYVIGLSRYYSPNAQVENYLNVLGYIIVLWLFAFVLNGMYRQYTGPLARMNEATAIVKGVILGTFEVMAFTFLYKSFPESRYVLAYAAIIAIILLIVHRNILSMIMTVVHHRGLGNMRAAIIGNSVLAQRIAEKIHLYPETGFNYIGFIADHEPQTIIHPLKNTYKRLGKLSALETILKKYHINALFLTDETLALEKIYEMAEFCRTHGVFFRFTPSKYRLKEYSVSFDALDSIPLMKVNRIEFSQFNHFLKRSFDLLVTLPLFIIFLPIMLIIALLIKLTSPGEIIYKQIRFTKDGREFEFLKFRSMRTDAEHGRPILSTKDQRSRTTKIGNFLRKTSLDELPQLFNIIRGDMSLVGPRPERPFFHNKYLKAVPRWNERLIVRGGLTGWAQINGRAELSASPLEKLEYDLYYIANWSLLFDIKILLNTIIKVILQKDTY